MATAPQPVPSPYAGLSLREIIRDQLHHSPVADPHVIVAHTYRLLDDDQLEEAARFGLHQLAVDEAQAHRNRAMTKPTPPAQSAKWTGAARAAKARPDIFSAQVVIGRNDDGTKSWAFLGDCDRDMLEQASTLLKEQAAGYLDRANQYVALRKKLRGHALVRTLPRATVEAVFDA